MRRWLETYTLDTMNNLGAFSCKLRRYEAEHIFQQVLQVKEEDKGDNHIILEIVYNLGNLY